ncbi:SRSO17 transposase [Streptomyces luteogriseus]|uniref:SRSO17 transposase n=1 Tax=Streptomyces luteogriseus TaxID=68233 RepID=A0A7W7GJN2_9ACTN|nr:SRSO17 transposase [Streptomyces luteogriseus]
MYSAARGHAAIDRALYVPRSWTEAPDRCRSAGIPDGLAFATKPQLAARMVERALDAGAPARWVAGDEVYGDNPHLRTALEHRRTGYVLAVSSTHSVMTPAGKFQAKTLAARIPKRAWQRLSAGAGAKGERYYDWARIDIHDTAGWPGQWCLLVRRNRRTGELAFYRCFSPRPVPMSELVRVAGRRWTIEESSRQARA